MELLNQLLFVFSNGDKITDVSIETYDRIKSFIAELAAEYESTTFALSTDAPVILADSIVLKYPDIEAKCQQYLDSIPGVRRSIGTRGALAELIKLILENKESLIDLINLIIGFFPASSETAEQPS